MMPRLLIVPGIALAAMTVIACGAQPSAGAAIPELGRAIYTNCAACHGREGEGSLGPPFAENPNLADDSALLTQILKGSEHMPPFKEQLSDPEVVAVTNYIRARWLKAANRPISAHDVAAARQKIQP